MPAKRPTRIIAIDWDVRTVRIVHALAQKRGVKIDRILASPMPADVDPSDPAQVGRHIRRVLDQERIGTRHAIVDIPREQAVLKTLTLPAIRPEELAGVVEIQIAKELPFPASEGVIDFVASAKATPDAAAADVLVAVARREVVQQFRATFEQAGLKLDRVGLRPYANTVAVCDLLKFAMPDRVLLIDVRPNLTEIDVLKSSSLVFSRAASAPIPADIRSAGRKPEGKGFSFLPAPGEGDEARPDPLDRVVQSVLLEVTRSIEAYRVNDPGAQMDHAVIAGDTGIEETLAEAVQKRLGITTELYNPANSFGWAAEEGAAASAFSAALGLVLSQADPASAGFNFLDPKKMVSQAKERLRKAPIAAAAAVLFLIAGVMGFAAYTRHDRQVLAKLEEDIKALKAEESDNRKFLEFMDKVRKFDQDQHVWVDVLYDIFSVLPQNDELVLTQLDLDQKGAQVVLKTKAIGRETGTQVVSLLREFRREGRSLPRFDVGMGPQTERAGEEYPFIQDFRVSIRNDAEPKSKKASQSRT